MRIAEFPFTKIGRGHLGDIFRPYATVLLFAKTRKIWLPVNMVVDSGADYTLLPKRYASVLGIDLARDCVVEMSVGIGGSERVFLYREQLARLGKWQKKIPVRFLEMAP